MEELRSTEILDKEIQDDARKKAQRILVDADAECKKIIDTVESRIAATIKDKQSLYDAKLSIKTRDAQAAAPLERERFLVSFEGDAVRIAIDNYIKALSEEKRVSLIESLLKRYKPALKNTQVTAKVHGFPIPLIEHRLKDILGDKAVISCLAMSDAEAIEKESISGVIIESVDRSVLCRVTLDELVQEILDTYSYELASTLFGGSLPQ